MKWNASSLKLLAFILFLFFSATIKSQNELQVSASGTGRTTGHIADLSVTNSSNESVTTRPQTAYIPSDGQYQPYIGTIPGTTIPPHTTTTIPVDGYCADVTTPPVPSGDPMSPIDTWIPVEPIPSTGDGVPILPHDPVAPFDPVFIPDITTSPGFTPQTPTKPGPQPTWPGTDIPVGGFFKPNTDPKTIGPILVDAINDIAKTFDKLRDEGKIITPFSGDPEKEREAVIQQTFWIYTGSLRGKKYERETFGDKVIKQYSDNAGIPVGSIPKEDKEKLDSGVDEFWKTFTAVGIEAKVLSDTKSETDHVGDPELIAEGTPLVPIVDQISNAEKIKQDLKNCFFNKLEYSVTATHKYTRGSGNKAKNGKDEYQGNDKNEIEIKLKQKDTLEVNLVNLKCECLCWTAVEKDGSKSGTFCDCEITGVSLSNFNKEAFTDLTEPDFDKDVVFELSNEVAKKLDNLRKAGGKKSEIDKLQKQLDDEKKLRKENAARLAELKKQMDGPWRKNREKGQTSFVVKRGFVGTVEFDFKVQGKCKGDLTCKGSEFVRDVKVKVTVPK